VLEKNVARKGGEKRCGESRREKVARMESKRWFQKVAITKG
jgi:hypothetical protein